MEQKTNNNRSVLISVLLCALTVIGICVGIFLIVLGCKKSAEFKKTEKIEVTFTEPVFSVRYAGKDDDGEDTYEIKVKYTYNRLSHIYTITEHTEREYGQRSFERTPSSYQVGDMVTFTKYFTPDGEEIHDIGKNGLRGAGIVITILSVSWLAVIIFLIKLDLLPGLSKNTADRQKIMSDLQEKKKNTDKS